MMLKIREIKLIALALALCFFFVVFTRAMSNLRENQQQRNSWKSTKGAFQKSLGEFSAEGVFPPSPLAVNVCACESGGIWG